VSNVVCACAALPLHRSAERWRWQSCVGVRLSQCGRNRRWCRIISPSLCTIIHWLARKNVCHLSGSRPLLFHSRSNLNPHTYLCVHWFYSFDGVCVCGHDLVCVLLVNSSWSVVWLYLGVCVCVCDVCVNGEEESESVWNGAMIGWTPFWKRRKKEPDVRRPN
jgi:hypothetical protein